MLFVRSYIIMLFSKKKFSEWEIVIKRKLGIIKTTAISISRQQVVLSAQ